MLIESNSMSDVPARRSDAHVATPCVDIRQVHKFYEDFHVLCGIDLTINRGEVCVAIGPSGSGKSTLLRCINQLEQISAGRIYVDDELVGYREAAGKLYQLSSSEVACQRRSIGIVFQRFNLFPHMTALENVMSGPVLVKGNMRKEARSRGLALLDRVGLGMRAHHYPSQLSGGQQQRVAIARALAMEPSLMLFDEPTSALDPELVGEVLEVIRDVAASGMTVMLVTHEIGFAREIASNIVFMDGGMIVESGRPLDVLQRPQSPRTQSFLAKVL